MDSGHRWRRRQLLNAAIRVMQRTGYHQMSMQALAEEAGVSVGLTYRYFSGKEDVLLAAILDILDALRAELPSAADAGGATAAQRLCAGFGAYIQVIDRHRSAVLLTYRKSATLSQAGRSQIKDLEVATAGPLASAISDGPRQRPVHRLRRQARRPQPGPAGARVGAEALAVRQEPHRRGLHQATERTRAAGAVRGASSASRRGYRRPRRTSTTSVARSTQAAIVTLNRPHRYNAFRGQTVEELIAAFRAASADKSVRAVILTGAGDKAFCTGGDVKQRAETRGLRSDRQRPASRSTPSTS